MESYCHSGFVLFRVLQIPRLSMTFSMTLGLAVTFKNFQNFTRFSIFFTINSSTGNELWYPPKCMPFAPFHYSSLSYIILALSSAAKNLPNKTLIFHDFQGPKINFNDFPGLENDVLTFHDFPGFR